MQEVRVYSHDGPIRLRKRGYILTMDQSCVHSGGWLWAQAQAVLAAAPRARVLTTFYCGLEDGPHPKGSFQ
eukprot:273660-Pyramimonas_sp.AAC.1